MSSVIRCLILLLLWAPLHVSAQGPKRVALLIGNSAYESAGALSNPGNDVRMVAEAARQAGFTTVTVQENLGIRQFQQALRAFRDEADGAQIAMIYYAGHGMEGNGDNWLIPTDAGLLSDRDLPFEAINLDQVMQSIEGATLRMVVLDACRNNPFGRKWRSGSRSVGRGLAGLEFDDVLVIYSAAPGQLAADGDGKNSPFASALTKRLTEPGLPIQMLGGAVRDDVLSVTQGEQRPFVSASITGTACYLVPKSTHVIVADISAARTGRAMDPVRENWVDENGKRPCGKDCDEREVFLSGDWPVYPANLIEKGSPDGVAEVEYVVGARGVITSAKVLWSNRDEAFTPAILQAMSTWKYKPAMRDGKPVDMQLNRIFTIKAEK